MRYRLILICLLLCSQMIQAREKRPYTRADWQLSLEHPDTWRTKEYDEKTVLNSPVEKSGDPYQEQIVISRELLTDNNSEISLFIAASEQSISAGLPSAKNYVIKDIRTKSGLKGKELSYEAEVSGIPMHISRSIFMQGSYAYILTYARPVSGLHPFDKEAIAIVRTLKLW